MNYIRLDKAPKWCIQYPTCSACAVDLSAHPDTTVRDNWVAACCTRVRGSDGKTPAERIYQ